eukprot:scaffold1680_cov391-Prasinococcus_capsulatus_cf.AAC.4
MDTIYKPAAQQAGLRLRQGIGATPTTAGGEGGEGGRIPKMHIGLSTGSDSMPSPPMKIGK